MKTAIKLFALLLALLMLVPCFAACNGGGDDQGDETTTAGNGGDETTGGDDETTTESQYVNMNGYEYKAYAWLDAHAKESGDPMNPGFYAIDFYYESVGDSKDPVTVATWQRNQRIETNYNCFIRPTKATNTHTSELTSLWNGGHKYDLAIILDKHAATCATMNLLTDLMSKKNLKLDQPYYDQNSIKQLGMGGKLYYLTGDMNASTLDNAVVTLVNEKMYNDTLITAGEKPIYDLVKSGEWTMYKMKELAEKANLDVGEDNTYSADAGDIWGYLPYGSSGVYHFYGCGGRITNIDEDGYPEMVIDSDASKKALTVIMDTINIQKRPTGIASVGGSNRNTWFTSEKVLFTDTIMWDVRKAIYPKVETWKYGILPLALVGTEQFDPNSPSKGYITAVQYGYNGTTALWTMPSFYNNVDYATILFNAFAEESYAGKAGSTMEAFFTRTISLQAAKDENSRQMVEIVRTGMAYDIAGCYDADWGGFQSVASGSLNTTANPLASITAAAVGQAKMKMEQTLEEFKDPQSPDL